MDGFKYGLMAFSHLGNRDGEAAEVAPTAWTFVGKLDSLFKEDEVAHWREWIGSNEWRELTAKHRMISVRMPSTQREVMNAENQDLQRRLFHMRTALLLTSPNGLVWGENWFLDGEAHGLAPTHPLKSIQTYGRGETIVRPYYCTRESYWRGRPPDHEAGWLERWREAIALVENAAQGGFPPLLFFGLLAYERAFESHEIEFKIPDCVRAVEAIVGLPNRGGGREVFANRVLALLPSVHHDWFVGGDQVRERLVRLYVHRNECVHGMVPFGNLQREGLDGPEEAARFDYLAELVARGGLLAALRHPRAREIFATREVLEREWTEGRFP